MTQVTLIAAVARNGVIGNGPHIPWHLPEDFAYFKRTTMGHVLVMGRLTFESIGRAAAGPTDDRRHPEPLLAARGRRGGALVRGGARAGRPGGRGVRLRRRARSTPRRCRGRTGCSSPRCSSSPRVTWSFPPIPFDAFIETARDTREQLAWVTYERPAPPDEPAPERGRGRQLPATQHARDRVDDQLVVLELRQPGDGHGPDASGAAQQDRERTAVGRERAGSSRALSSNDLPSTRNCSPTLQRRVAVTVHDRALAGQPRLVVGGRTGQRGEEQQPAVASDRDRDRQASSAGLLPKGRPQLPGRVVVEPVEHQPRLLGLELVEQVAAGHAAALVAVWVGWWEVIAGFSTTALTTWSES